MERKELIIGSLKRSENWEKQALENNNKEAAKKEFADVLAWLASLANSAGIDLETAALEKYNHKCPKCGYSPCRCCF